jgi:hypothetical protein
MAKQTGILKIEGTLDQLTFYKSIDGNLVRTKGGVSGERIANDPVFIRTRENGAEFGMAATAGKVLRDSVRSLLLNGSDKRVTSRLTKLMTEIKNFDSSSPRGLRQIFIALNDPAAMALLKGFNFNINSALGSILFKPYTLDTLTGTITIDNLVPLNDIAFPEGATHVSFLGAFAAVDFNTNDYDAVYTTEINLPIDGTSTQVVLTPPNAHDDPSVMREQAMGYLILCETVYHRKRM